MRALTIRYRSNGLALAILVTTPGLIGCDDSVIQSAPDQSFSDMSAEFGLLLDMTATGDAGDASASDSALDAHPADADADDSRVDGGACRVTASADVQVGIWEFADPPGVGRGDIVVLTVQAGCAPCPQLSCEPTRFSWRDLSGNGRFYERLRDNNDPSQGGMNDFVNTPQALYYVDVLPARLSLTVGLNGMGEIVNHEFGFVLSEAGELERSD